MWLFLQVIGSCACSVVLASEPASLERGSRACLDEQVALLQTVSVVHTRGPLSFEDTSRLSSSAPRKNSTQVVSNLATGASAKESGPATEHGATTPVKTRVYTPESPPPSAIVILGQAVLITTGVLLFILLILAGSGHLKKWLPPPKQMSSTELQDLRTSWGPWALLCSYMAVQTMMTDQYLPSLAQMQADFGTTSWLMSFTLQANWLVKALSALGMAGLADSFGRKPMFVLCTVLTCVGSLSCACAPSVSWFIGGRVIQGIAEGGEPLFAMLACDMMEDADERMSYTSGIFALLTTLPAVAPFLGGVMGYWFSWRVPFVVLASWGFVNAIFAPSMFRETRPVNSDNRSIADYRAEFSRVFGDRHVLLLAFMQGAAMMTILSVDVNLSLILAHWFGQNQFQIALKLAFIAAVLLVVGLVPGLLVQQFGSVNVLRGIIMGSVIPMCTCFLVGSYGADMRYTLVLLLCICVTQGFCVSSTIVSNTLYFKPLKEVSRAAAGINTCLTMLCVVFGTLFTTTVKMHADDLVKNLLNWLAFLLLVVFLLFWPCFGFKPPSWALDGEEKTDAVETATEDLKTPQKTQKSWWSSQQTKT